MKIEFSTMHFVVEENAPTVGILKPVFIEKEDKDNENDIVHIIEKENIDDKYFWLYAKYGKAYPHSPTVFNTKKEKEEENPRTTNQIETNDQLFVLYNINSHTLFISNVQKKSWLQNYLKKKLERDVIIKNFYKNKNEFMGIIKSIEKVKFVAKRNLFTSSDNSELMKIFPSPKDIFGLGEPEECSLEAKFKKVKLTPAFEAAFTKMQDWVKNYEADSLLCVGYDDKNMETVFNMGSFIQKINIDTQKDEQGLFNPENVQKALLEKIGGSNEN